MKGARDYQKDLIRDLKDSDEAAAYLNAALESDDPKAFLLALRNVADAQGSISKIARACRLNRVSVYKMTSESGNPSLGNILKVIRAIGLNLQVVSHSTYCRHKA